MKKLLTICTIRKGSKVLLGLKKRGFGVGRWNGFGGKVGPSETIEDAAKRELFEEANIKATAMEKVGILEFQVKGEMDVKEVHIFRVDEYSGEPVEGEEMKPRWFNIDELPFDAMWADDRYWVPVFLEGKKFKGKFLFAESDMILEHELNEVKEL